MRVKDSGGVRKEILTQRTCGRNPYGHVLRISSLEDVDLHELQDRPPSTKENIDTSDGHVSCPGKTRSADKDRGQSK